MNQPTQSSDDNPTAQFTDLPLTTEHAEQTKAGTSLSGEGKKVVIDFCKTS